MSLADLDVQSLASGLIRSAQDELKETWGELKQREAAEIQAAAKDLARLLAQRLRPGRLDYDKKEDDIEIGHATARIANWSFVAADKVRVRWAAFLEEAAEQAGKVLKAVGKGLLA